MRLLKVILVTLLLAFLFVVPTKALAKPDNSQPKQLILVIDRLKLDDISEQVMPNLFALESNGSIALMNTNTADKREPENTYITIANGQLSKGGELAGDFYKVSDPVNEPLSSPPYKNINAGMLYSSLTGWELKNTSIVNPWIADIIQQNKNSNRIVVGSLGEYLNSFGISRAVIGNSDSFVPRRLAAFLVMDKKGRVPNGNIGAATIEKDASFPSGYRTNYDHVFLDTSQALKSNQLVVVEMGDLSRLEAIQGKIIDDKYTNSRKQAINNIDNFIKEITPLLDLNKDQVMILVPTPSMTDQNNNNIVTPFIISGGKFPKGGVITSATTRRKGLISNIDIAPTVLGFYNITKDKIDFEGRPVSGIKDRNSLDYLKNFNRNLVLNYAQRPPLLYPTATLEIITILLSLLIIRFTKKRQVYIWFQRLALVFLLIPLIFLFYKFIRFPAVYLSITAIIGIIILFLALTERFKLNFKVKIIIICMFTSVALVIDLATGYNLMVNSPLGYDLMIGGRYYGIGNEFSGILLGSTLLGFSTLIQYMDNKGGPNLKKLPLAIYLLVIAYAIYAPNLGAEAGCFIAALAAFPYFLIIVNGGKMTPKKVAFLILGILLVLFAGAAVDHFVNGSHQSHIGQAMGELMQGKWQLILGIIVGKLGMNWKLIQFSIWSRVLLAVIAGLTFFTFYPKGIIKTIQNKYPYIFMGIKASVIASIVGCVFNDSGIVEAATSSLYIIFPIIYLVLQEKIEQIDNA